MTNENRDKSTKGQIGAIMELALSAEDMAREGVYISKDSQDILADAMVPFIKQITKDK
jgi:hypothetical protein